MGSLVLVPLATVGTAFISGLTGLGGGALLIGFLGSILNPIQAIFLHACFQAFSNVFRLWIHWRSLDKKIFYFFALAVLPGTYVGSMLLGKLPIPLLRIFLGIGLIISLLPKKKQQIELPGFVYSILGFAAGLFGCLMGAVGPLVARFFLKPGMTHGYFVGTKSACQFVVHVSKIILLGKFTVDLNLLTNPYIIVGFAGTFLGNFAAKQVGAKIPTELFHKLVKILLAFLGVQLMAKGLNFYLQLW